MLKIKKRITFKHSENRMKNEGNISYSILEFEKNKNLFNLLNERYNWMNNFIKESETGIEVGAAGGFTKKFIKCKNFKISDFSNHDHLDYKNIDAQKTGFEDNKFYYLVKHDSSSSLSFKVF